MNRWNYITAAERYARGRPYHQGLVVERIRRHLKLQGLMRRALDVGCGTGQSAIALKEIARRVVALDSSAEMLALAPRDRAIQYVNARAEALPLADGAFKLATVSSAFHWFERERFLCEVRRVLTARGWIVVYNNAFQARMRGNGEFRRAFRDLYPKRYPTPIRDWRPLTAESAARFGFDLGHEEKYTNEVTYTLGQFVDYLCSHSNVIEAVERGSERLDSVRRWLAETFAPFFPADPATFEFGGTISFLRKRPLASRRGGWENSAVTCSVENAALGENATPEKLRTGRNFGKDQPAPGG